MESSWWSGLDFVSAIDDYTLFTNYQDVVDEPVSKHGYDVHRIFHLSLQ